MRVCIQFFSRRFYKVGRGEGYAYMEDGDCPICFEPLYAKNVAMYRGACGHAFHVACLNTSVKAGNKSGCPYCSREWAIDHVIVRSITEEDQAKEFARTIEHALQMKRAECAQRLGQSTFTTFSSATLWLKRFNLALACLMIPKMFSFEQSFPAVALVCVAEKLAVASLSTLLHDYDMFSIILHDTHNPPFCLLTLLNVCEVLLYVFDRSTRGYALFVCLSMFHFCTSCARLCAWDDPFPSDAVVNAFKVCIVVWAVVLLCVCPEYTCTTCLFLAAYSWQPHHLSSIDRVYFNILHHSSVMVNSAILLLA